jgi:hypothetical protein
VVERSENLGFALETSNPICVPGKFVRQDLDGDIATELLVPGLIDLTHAAFADFSSDLIMARRLADHEGRLRRQRCSMMKSYLEFGPIVTTLDIAVQ